MIYIIPTDTCFGIACPLSERKDYHNIYKLKKRDWKKPLALLVGSFDWLIEHTDLTNEQINFLRSYEKPFTVLTDCDYVKMFMEFEDPEEGDFLNSNVYEQIAFRVAHTEQQKKLIKKEWPLFLTSANRSWDWEIYDIAKIEEMFEEEKRVDIRASSSLDEDCSVSDIFSFVWDTLEVEYLRKG